MMSDEEVIKRKLIFDGEGTAEDKRINLLQKLIVNWVSNSNLSAEENLTMLNKCLAVLAAIESSRIKSELIQKCYSKEMDLHKNFQDKMKENIENIQGTIEVSKVIVKECQIDKQHTLNCNLIAKNISAVKSRQETNVIVNEIEEVIAKMNEENSRLNAEWKRLRQHFTVISTSANELLQMLDQNKESSV